MYNIRFEMLKEVSASLFICSKCCVFTGCVNNQNWALFYTLHPEKSEAPKWNKFKYNKTFTICGVRTFGFLMISLKLTELEGGYNKSRLKRHPVYEWSLRFLIKYYLFKRIKHIPGVFLILSYCNPPLNRPILKISTKIQKS